MSRPLIAVAGASAFLLLTTGCGGGGSMPELRGRTERQAIKTLTGRELCSVLVSAADWPAARAAPSGDVVDQDPLPGAKVDHFSTITLWVKGTSDLGVGEAEIKDGCYSGTHVSISVSNTGG